VSAPRRASGAAGPRAVRAVLLLAAAAWGAASLARAEGGAEATGVVSRAGGRPRVLLLEIRSPITTGTAEYVEAGLARARGGGHDAVVVELDTPGGHLEATRDVVQRILASEVPVLVWVGPAGARAGSAGVFITLAAGLAAMHPTSNVGAAHPVLAGGADVEREAGKDMARKVENDTAAFARSIATSRGRNAEWAEKAVRESVSVTAEEARRLGVVDLVVPDLPALLAAADGRAVDAGPGKRTLRTRDAAMEPLAMSVRQRTLGFLSDPNVVALLMLVGTLGIALEFYHPGSIVPGAVGAFALLLAFLSMRIIPVNVGAVVLVLAGVALLVAEAFVTTHGIAGTAGAICVAVGTLLFIDRSSPDYLFDPAALTLSPWVVWPTPIAVAAVLGFVGWKVGRTRRERLQVGAPAMLGEIGQVTSDVGPEDGEVFVHGELWAARAEGHIPRGEYVRVRKVRGLVLEVEAQPRIHGALP
jgi:membrane-bound serine protease (ClpP class)